MQFVLCTFKNGHFLSGWVLGGEAEYTFEGWDDFFSKEKKKKTQSL